MKAQLTIVLPLYNQERQIRSIVSDVLDLAVQLRLKLQLVVVDNGSTDDTFETACELACRFPQVLALRQSVHGGLNTVADFLRPRIEADMIILHDGVSPIDVRELRDLVVQEVERADPEATRSISARSTMDRAGSRRFGTVRSLHERMERVHRRIAGFAWLKLDEQAVIPRRRQVIEQATPQRNAGPQAVVTTLLPDLSPVAAVTPTL